MWLARVGILVTRRCNLVANWRTRVIHQPNGAKWLSSKMRMRIPQKGKLKRLRHLGVSTRHCLASVCAAKIQQTPFLANTLSTLTSLNGTWYKYCVVMTTVDQGMEST